MSSINEVQICSTLTFQEISHDTNLAAAEVLVSDPVVKTQEFTVKSIQEYQAFFDPSPPK